jgi:hypothetical protein
MPRASVDCAQPASAKVHDDTKDASDHTNPTAPCDCQSTKQPLDMIPSSDEATKDKNDAVVGLGVAQANLPEPPYSVLSEPVKISVLLTASFAAIVSPISSSIYFPAIPTLSRDLHVSVSLITLTITTYLVRILPDPS